MIYLKQENDIENHLKMKGIKERSHILSICTDIYHSQYKRFYNFLFQQIRLNENANPVVFGILLKPYSRFYKNSLI